MPRIFSNNAVAVTSSAITSASTTIALATGQGAKFPTPSGGDYFMVTLAMVSGVTETSWEIVKVTARSGDSLTVVRAQEGTTAAAWPSARRANRNNSSDPSAVSRNRPTCAATLGMKSITRKLAWTT